MIGRNHKAEDHQTELLLGLEDPRCVRGKMVAGAGHRFALERAFYLAKDAAKHCETSFQRSYLIGSIRCATYDAVIETITDSSTSQ
jgi:hypothetical protein